jgi:hypothetical protein
MISAPNCHMMSSIQNKIFSVNSKLIRLYECSTIPHAVTRKQFLGTIPICKRIEDHLTQYKIFAEMRQKQMDIKI